MARQQHTPHIPLGQFGDYSVANSADMVFLPSDVANKEATKLTGKELIIARNLTGGAINFQIDGVPDFQNRTENITGGIPGLPANTWAVFGPFNLDGWQQSDGNIFFQGNAVGLEWAVIRIP